MPTAYRVAVSFNDNLSEHRVIFKQSERRIPCFLETERVLVGVFPKMGTPPIQSALRYGLRRYDVKQSLRVRTFGPEFA
jgi:hypothetical protein